MLPAIHKAVDFLITAQQQGQWQDYNLPVGISTEWASGYIGWALAEAAQCWNLPQATIAAQQAASYLTQHRSYPVGWGYNSNTGPDSDSTACVIALLDAIEYPVAEQDRQFLRLAWCDNEGFITYVDGKGAWAKPHLDILWPALKGARLDSVATRWQSLQDKLQTNFNISQGWQGYWWKGPWYCTFHLLLAAHWQNNKTDFIFTPEAGPLSVTSFSAAAWIAGSLLLSGHMQAGITLFQQIIHQQKTDGSWESSPDLRVTNPDIYIPDDSPQSGKFYADQNRLMTTASVLRALCTTSQIVQQTQTTSMGSNKTIEKEFANDE